jgi:YegS/Rv2252/BmrU family lipid kinase
MAARTEPRVLDTVSRAFASEGWELEVAGTNRPGHAEELARKGAEGGVDRVVVYGGDGTTMQVVKGLMHSDVPVALVPGGTGNLLAGNLRLPRQPGTAARVAAQGVPRPIDIGVMARNDGDHYFAVACGAGFDAELMGATTEEAKRRWRMGAYVAQVWESLSDIQVVEHRITVDGEAFEAEAVMVLVANCGEIVPPFLRLREGIAPDDGVFDVVVVNASTVVEGVDIVWRMLTGRVESNHRVRFASGKVVTVETATPRPVELDGEVVGSTPFTARILPHSMNIVMPRQ